MILKLLAFITSLRLIRTCSLNNTLDSRLLEVLTAESGAILSGKVIGLNMAEVNGSLTIQDSVFYKGSGSAMNVIRYAIRPTDCGFSGLRISDTVLVFACRVNNQWVLNIKPEFGGYLGPGLSQTNAITYLLKLRDPMTNLMTIQYQACGCSTQYYYEKEIAGSTPVTLLSDYKNTYFKPCSRIANSHKVENLPQMDVSRLADTIRNTQTPALTNAANDQAKNELGNSNSIVRIQNYTFKPNSDAPKIDKEKTNLDANIQNNSPAGATVLNTKPANIAIERDPEFFPVVTNIQSSAAVNQSLLDEAFKPVVLPGLQAGQSKGSSNFGKSEGLNVGSQNIVNPPRLNVETFNKILVTPKTKSEGQVDQNTQTSEEEFKPVIVADKVATPISDTTIRMARKDVKDSAPNLLNISLRQPAQENKTQPTLVTSTPVSIPQSSTGSKPDLSPLKDPKSSKIQTKPVVELPKDLNISQLWPKNLFQMKDLQLFDSETNSAKNTVGPDGKFFINVPLSIDDFDIDFPVFISPELIFDDISLKKNRQKADYASDFTPIQPATRVGR